MQNPPPGPPPGGDQPGYRSQGEQPPGYPPPGQQPPEQQPPEQQPPGQQPPGQQPPGQQPPGYPPPGQQPPGYPPQGYQDPYQQQPYQSGAGVDKKSGAILSYLLGWVTGIIFLFVGKNDPDVKYHAAQSTIFFGGMTIIFWLLYSLGPVIGLLFVLSWLVFILSIVGWVFCLVQANSYGGARFKLPIVGDLITPYVEQLANAV